MLHPEAAMERDSSDEDEMVMKGPAWESILGYGTDGLQKLLSPGRAFHKKKFELSIEPLVFLGCPMHVREDGTWRKKRRPKAGSEEDEDQIKSKESGSQLSLF